MGFVDGGVHFGDLFGEGGEVLLAAALGGQGGELALEDAAGFEHLPGLETVQRTEQTEGGFAEFRRAVGDEGADAVADVHNAHGREIADACAEAGAADAQLAGKLALRRNAIAGL